MSTSTDPAPGAAVADDEVERARPVACWSVRGCEWQDQLPDEVVALLAPPVIVSAEAFVPAAQPSPASDHDDVQADYHPRHAAPEGSAPRFVTPTLARRLRRRRPLHAA